MPNEIKKIRENAKLTQKDVANLLKMSLRSYISYENDEKKINTIKYKYIKQELMNLTKIDEQHGILTLNQIQETCNEIFKDYDIDYCYLFGSYAKGKQNANSDIDLLLASNINGIKFFGLIEKLKTELHKNIDLLDLKQLNNNPKLLNEILKDGIKIYG